MTLFELVEEARGKRVKTLCMHALVRTVRGEWVELERMAKGEGKGATNGEKRTGVRVAAH